MLAGDSAMKNTYRAVMLSGVLVALGSAVMCSSDNRTDAPSPDAPSPTAPSSPTTGATIATDAALLQLVTQAEPFGSYSLFPNAEAINRDASSAHRPADRVRMNARALTALQNGRLPPGTQFPDGSVIFKEVLTSNGATTTLYSIMYKEADNLSPRTAGYGRNSIRPAPPPTRSITAELRARRATFRGRVLSTTSCARSSANAESLARTLTRYRRQSAQE